MMIDIPLTPAEIHAILVLLGNEAECLDDDDVPGEGFEILVSIEEKMHHALMACAMVAFQGERE